MAMQEYKEFNFKPETYRLIATINDILAEFEATGDVVTVRQLYYQLVARNIIPNTEKSYKKITGVVNDGRLAGLIDWDAIEDRTREVNTRNRWSSGREILENSARGFHMDLWDNQPCRLFAIVEKEALFGALHRTCWQYDVPLLPARGYPSGTVLREFAHDHIMDAINYDQRVVILHLGDHDPSGMDMSRDLEERIRMFAEDDDQLIQFERIALNMDQILELKPPPNPAKSTDARFKDYERRFGSKSWELDALSPTQLRHLLQGHLETYIDPDLWKEREEEIANVKKELQKVADNFHL